MTREPSGPSLDLYAGLEAPTPADSVDSGPAPRAAPDAPDWVALVWRDFPPAVQARYRPIAVAGEGGMGVVLEAHDTLLDRRVAVKGPRDPARVDARWRERLAAESRLHARLAHPNILPIHDAWSDARGLPWCAMLFVPPSAGHAPTLAGRLAALSGTALEQRPVAALLGVFLQVCRAVGHAHAQSVLHRDLKPANILLEPTGEALVADWGVATTLPAEAREIVGTPGYAAPEQLGGGAAATVRSDVYGLGVILREMLTGQPDGALTGRVPRELAGIVTRATAADPDARFATAAALQQAVETYLEGGLVEGLAYSAPERLRRWARRQPALSAGLLTALVLSGIFVTGLVSKMRTALRNLAESHAARAVALQKDGRTEEARLWSALAYRDAADSRRGLEFQTDVAVIFASRTLPGPLIWAARPGKPVPWVRVDPREKRAAFVTTRGVLTEMDLAGAPVEHVQDLGGQPWMSRSSDDGRRLATAGPGTPCRVFERGADRWTLMREVPRGNGPVALSADGTRLAIVEDDHSVRIYAVPGFQPVARLAGTPGFRISVRFSPDGRRVVTVGENCVTEWELAHPERPFEYEPPRTTALDAAYSPDGRTLAVVGGGPGPAWLYATGNVSMTARLGHELAACYTVAFSPDGRYLATAGQDARLLLWDLSHRQEAAQEHEELQPVVLAGHAAAVLSLAFGADGRTLASGAEDGTVRLWDVRGALEEVGRTPHGRTARQLQKSRLALSPDGALFAVSGSDPSGSPADQLVIVAERSTGRVRERRRAPAGVDALALDAAGRVHVAWTTAEGVRACALTEGAQARLAIPGASRPRFGADPRLIAATLADGRAALTAPDGSWRALAGPDGGVSELAFSPDDRTLALGGARGGVLLHDLAGGAPVAFQATRTEVQSFGFDPAAGLLAVGGNDSTAHVFEIASRRELCKLQQLGPVRSVAVSGARDRVFLGGPVGLSTFALSTGSRVFALEVSTEPVWALQLAPDAAWLASLRSGQPTFWELSALDDPYGRAADIEQASLFVPREDRGAILVPPPAAARPVRWTE